MLLPDVAYVHFAFRATVRWTCSRMQAGASPETTMSMIAYGGWPVAITESHSGSAVTIGATELSLVSGTTTLQSVTDDGIYQVFIEDNNMAANDEYAIKVKEKTIAGSTQRIVYAATLIGQQAEPVVGVSGVDPPARLGRDDAEDRRNRPGVFRSIRKVA